MKAYFEHDIGMICLNVTLFDENMKLYFTVWQNVLTLSLDLDPHSSKKLDPDPHKNNCGSGTLMSTITLSQSTLQP
jgi:hypothetical protein